MTLDAAAILGNQCCRKLVDGCAYSAIHLREVFRRDAVDIGSGATRWRFGVGG